MNKARRNIVAEMVKQLGDIRDNIGITLEEEGEYRDSIPENMRRSEWYEITENICCCLEDAFDGVDAAVEHLVEVQKSAHKTPEKV